MSALESKFTVTALASGLVKPSQLDYIQRLARARAGGGSLTPQDIDEAAIISLIVEQGLLTRYQADQLASGRTKLTLGPYLITDWIGQGGMGQVFKAVHQVMGRECAVKVLPLHRVTPEALDSFSREIRLQAKLDCPYLVRAFDAGQDGNVHYLVTEYIPGMDLRKLVKSRGPLPIHQAAGIIMQAAMGLDYAHQQGMIHRDVKPGNILVTPEGVAKVSDVGLAGFAVDLLNDPRAGKIVGTADYLSPEQIRTPLDITKTTDIYSLGCSLYYAVCGKVPFPGGDSASKIRRHLHETPCHPRKFQSELNEEFIDIIADMMDKNPSERIQTCSEIVLRLEPWAGAISNLTSSRLMRGPWAAPPPTLEQATEGIEDQGLDATSISHDGSNTQRDGSLASLDSQRLPRDQVAPPIQHDLPHFAPSLQGTPSHLRTTDTQNGNSRNQSTTNPWVLVAVTVALVLPPALVAGGILGFMLHHYLQ